MGYFSVTGTAATNAAETAQAAAEAAENAATAAKTEVLAALDTIDDRNLGAKASDPSVDNDGNALLTGAQYFNTTDNTMRVYNGTAWQLTAPIGALIDSNNLSDVSSAATARSNLGLGTAATTDASAYATAAQADQTVALTGAGATTVSGTYPNFTITSVNTTYSVGDGGLTQNNFTNALLTKLDGIETSADVTDTANVVAALTAGTDISIAADGTISSTAVANSDTTYQTSWVDSSNDAILRLAASTGSNDDLTFVAGTNITLTPSGDDLTLATTATVNDTDANLKARANHTGTQAISTVSGLQTALDAKQPVITPNTAFNKNFGTASGTVAEGNDARLSDSRPCNNTFDNADTAKTNLSLNNVENKSSATIRSEIVDSDIPASIARDTELTSGLSGKVDKVAGKDLSTNDLTTPLLTKLNGIETSADVTDTANVVAALTAGNNVTIAADGTISATDTNTTYSVGDGGLTQNNFTDALKTKLDGIETSADVTDTANVTAAGALMDSEVDADIKTLALPANTTISDFAKTLVDDTDAATARTTLGLGTAATTAATDYATAAQGTTADNALPKSGGAMTGAITTNSTFDGRDVATDGAKLDGIEAGATADQTAAEIRTLVDSATDSNVFTDADHTKLNAIEANATADQTDAEIRAAVEAATDSNVFTDADHTKLNGIETGATADQTGAEIKIAYEGESNTNAFTDAEKSKLTGIETSATADQTDAEIETAYNNQVAQVSSAERTAGTETGIKRYSPADVKSMIDQHSGQASVTAAAVNNVGAVMETDYDAGTLLFATSDNSPKKKTVTEFSDIFFSQNHYLNSNTIYAKGTSSSPNTQNSIAYNSTFDGWRIQGNNGVQIENQLYISGSVNKATSYGYLNSGGNTGTGSGTNPYSIYTAHRVAASEFNAHSDARIKDIVSLSEGKQDAQTLQDIQITDFTYKETGQSAKKVIAQQVEEVYPQAVTKIQKCIPDILRDAEFVVSLKQDKSYLTTITLKDHNLTAGDFVELESSADNSKIQAEVLSVTHNEFKVKTDRGLSDAFIVGRRVDDFRVVDYEAISMLAVSALQHEIKRRKAMEENLKDLEQRIMRLEGSNNDIAT